MISVFLCNLRRIPFGIHENIQCKVLQISEVDDMFLGFLFEKSPSEFDGDIDQSIHIRRTRIRSFAGLFEGRSEEFCDGGQFLLYRTSAILNHIFKAFIVPISFAAGNS